ncbi:MAG TPA: mercuric reductase [Fimbriimonas sp.]|nr:mercuric reductase [Fimbriimonas sp.]
MRFDAIVVGSGQSGNPLAVKLAEKGWQVALVERGELGGTCVNRGCTPTKTMVHRAQVAHYARRASRWGVHASSVRVDLEEVVRQKNAVVKSWRESVEEEIAGQKSLKLFRAEARFVAPHKLEVGGEVLESDKIFIDTGGRPAVPSIEGLDEVPYLTSDTILDLEVMPDHLLVIGGGYIGLEFGQMFRRFGSKVTIIQDGGQIVPREDPEIAETLQRALEEEEIEFRLDTKIERLAHNKRFSVHVNGKTVSGSHLLVATGRKANSEDLCLETAGVKCDSRGAILVNDRLETNVPGIWAMGDVNGGPAFTHISYNDYQIVYSNVAEGKSRSTKGRVVPYCVFTDPQLGGVGITEKQARKQGYRLKIGSLPMSSVARAVERDESAGMMKLVVDASNDMILGATVLGVEGGETVQILSVLMQLRQPYTAMKEAIYTHPTLAEGLFRLFESVKPA